MKQQYMETAKSGKDLIAEMNETVPEKGQAAFWWLGQLGYALKLGDVTFYIDAFLSERPDRRIAPLFDPGEITNADYIIGTHDHSDHIDRNVWHQLSLSSPKAAFLVPEKLIPSLSTELQIDESRFLGLNDGKTLILKRGIQATGAASAHEFLDQDPVTGQYPYTGVVLEGMGVRLYHSGDTCIYEGLYSKLRSFGDMDVMFLPINGRDGERYRSNIIGNMTYQEAVDLAGAIKPGLAVPGHYEMFSGNQEDPDRFEDYITVKYPGLSYWLGRHGERVLYTRPAQ
nr:MBL fold metallo-hydrolase [uncultured Clostridium sp.]